jgi:hypothetical protein
MMFRAVFWVVLPCNSHILYSLPFTVIAQFEHCITCAVEKRREIKILNISEVYGKIWNKIERCQDYINTLSHSIPGGTVELTKLQCRVLLLYFLC